MSAATHRTTASETTKETPRMPKRLAQTLAALIGAAALLLAALPVASASAASPWWQVLTSSRPTNMWLPPDESMVQELQTEKIVFFGTPLPFAASVEVGGSVVGCLGEGAAFGFTAEQVCQAETGHSADATAAELQTTLESTYGPGNVEVAGGPVDGDPFIVTTSWDTPPVRLTVLSFMGVPLGTASDSITSEGSGRLALSAINLGNAPLDATTTPLAITDTLPEGIAAYGIATAETSGGEPVDCTVQSADQVSCSFDGTLPPFNSISVEILVALTSTDAGDPGRVAVSGGNAERVVEQQRVKVSEEATPFGVANLSVEAQREGGDPATQAGSHPFQLVTTMQLNRGPVVPVSAGGTQFLEEQPALPRDFRFRLPAGLVGDATELPRCSYAEFGTDLGNFVNACPDDAAIGVAWVHMNEPNNFGDSKVALPVFNLPPGNGNPARFGFSGLGVPIFLDPAVRIGNSYAISVNVKDTSQLAQLYETSVALWGVPADPRHDASRGWDCAGLEATAAECPTSNEQAPFLRLPTACAGPLGFSMEAEPWNVPRGTQVATASHTGTALDGCSRVPFDPELSVSPTTSNADSPSGLDVSLRVPQAAGENPEGISPSDVKNTTVTLPPELQINAAAANGLAACTEDQVGFSHLDPATGEAIFNDAPAECPQASKIGRVRIQTPLLDEDVTGWVYQAAQGDNPFGSLLGIYVVADAPRSGIHVKLAGKVDPGPEGQLTSTFTHTPQLPFEEFELRFFGGPGAALATTDCATYTTEGEIEPWSGNAPAARSSSFQVTSAVDGGACTDPRPFEPSMVAGSLEPQAGKFSPFVMRFRREDGAQQLSEIETVLPEGMVGRLAGIPYCPEDAIAEAQSRGAAGQGQAELDDPSCPADSRVGEVRVASGVGPNPVRVGGTAYLAGPYDGAPLSLAIVTPAVTGPFDLGVVVVRVALDLDPRTAQITARSDEIPTILHGIPLNVRMVAVRMDREEFTLNPTSCEETQVTGTATSTEGTEAALANRFQVGGCRALSFDPRIGFEVVGRNATKRNAHPTLVARLRANPDHANIGAARVVLPSNFFLDQANLANICTRDQYAAEECPEVSEMGRAVAQTPLLDQPLRGTVYLVASDNPLPDLVADLNGQIDIDLHGRIDSGGGHIGNTFTVVPDAPVSAFDFAIQGGPGGILVNSKDLCDDRSLRRVRAAFASHAGHIDRQAPVIHSQRCVRVQMARLIARARELARRAERARLAGDTERAQRLSRRSRQLSRRAVQMRSRLARRG